MTKNERVKKALETRIGKLNPGDKLPPEIEIGKEYGVSRMTVNKVIARLAEDGVVYRRTRAGTFVSGCRQRQSPLYLLVPHPGCLEQYNFISKIYIQLIGALQRITLGKVIPVIPVAISKTNDENDIDERNMEVIEPGGTVICWGIWYRNTFQWLAHRKCKVIYINNQIAEDVFAEPKRWRVITLDFRQAATDVVRSMKLQGCQSPAFIPLLYRNKRTNLPHPFVDGWRAGMQKYFPENSAEESILRYYPEDDSPEDLQKMLAGYLEDNPCDALFVTDSSIMGNCMPVFQKYRELIKKDLFLVTHRVDDSSFSLPVTCFDFSVRQVASAVLEHFNESIPLKSRLQADFFTDQSYNALLEIPKKAQVALELAHV